MRLQRTPPPATPTGPAMDGGSVDDGDFYDGLDGEADTGLWDFLGGVRAYGRIGEWRGKGAEGLWFGGRWIWRRGFRCSTSRLSRIGRPTEEAAVRYIVYHIGEARSPRSRRNELRRR
jgi:hypothetical protein